MIKMHVLKPTDSESEPWLCYLNLEELLSNVNNLDEDSDGSYMNKWKYLIYRAGCASEIIFVLYFQIQKMGKRSSINILWGDEA